MEYIPPLVIGNKLDQYKDVKNTLDEEWLGIGGYIRISTKKDSQKTSIDNQKKYIREWARINKFNVADFYTDVKSGAYSYLRNDLTRLKNDIASGKIKGIVSKEISRTSRDILDIIELKRGLADQGAFFISIKEGYDSRTDDDEFLLVIHAGLAQKERKTTSSRVKITQMIKANEGKTNVTKPALGYMLSEDRQYLVVNPDTADVYKLIKDKFLFGWGRLKIAKYLNSQGIKSPRGNGGWSTNTILNILTNPVYLGVYMYNVSILVRDSSGKAKRMIRPREDWVIKEKSHPALITPEEFERIQQIIQERREKDNKEWSCTKTYLLSGFLYCASCGSKLYGNKLLKDASKKKHKDELTPEDYYYYYVDKKATSCKHKIAYYHMNAVDNAVIDTIKNLFTSDCGLDKRIKSKQYIYDTRLEKEKKAREDIVNKIASVNTAIKKQQLAYEAEAITIEEYKGRLAELREQKSNFEKKLYRLNQSLERLDSMEGRFYEIKEKVKAYIENLNLMDYDIKEEIIRKTIKRVIISEDYSLVFEYTFEE
ncbi:DNA invertase Pin-like site-specific DNA recombinase [Ruminiclostridium sufflavum DSM 19573]|uniref:DNA invertase Pin-like site-specific DNA recombinase n=1 Tax=Ruminiclostridium sufflavum DSM 19573 TaxID=1121337 RepID=A0A318XJ09_9FIRM|nr:recombinase family protein [Ruminiclostridium sufflavum]PYG87004.1 DNA invertase Pin-like site-specific DNA recombinase [Ruminiclostridium sufflavum DSM 19573]